MDEVLTEISAAKAAGEISMDEAPSDAADAEFARTALIRYERALTRYAAHLTGDLDQAREVVQDTFLKLCSQKPSRIRNHLAQWLYTVCRNRALDVRRKEKRMTSISEARLEMQVDSRAEPHGLAVHREQVGLALEILGTLPRSQQEVLRLKFQGELSYREISSITNLSVANVGFLIHTGLKTVRETMKARQGAAAMRRVK